jgi:hypothetical protein
MNSFKFAENPNVAAEASVGTGDANWEERRYVWILAVGNKLPRYQQL